MGKLDQNMIRQGGFDAATCWTTLMPYHRLDVISHYETKST